MPAAPAARDDGEALAPAMIDPLLLRTFLLIAEGHSFSEASRRLSLRQSTVSDHVRKLEASLGRQLFTRDTHSVALTAGGEALIPFAREILEAHERARRHFAGESSRGRLRLGLSAEIGAARLMPVLRDFAASHAGIELEIAVAPAAALQAAFANDDLDLAIGERWPGEGGGEPLWREELAFVQRQADDALPPVLPPVLPLVLPPAPSLTRTLALAALERAGHPWRIACTSHARDGAQAAVAAGIGIGVMPDGPLPPGLAFVEGELPVPEPLDVVVRRHRGASGTAELLALIRARLCDE